MHSARRVHDGLRFADRYDVAHQAGALIISSLDGKRLTEGDRRPPSPSPEPLASGAVLIRAVDP